MITNRRRIAARKLTNWQNYEVASKANRVLCLRRWPLMYPSPRTMGDRDSYRIRLERVASSLPTFPISDGDQDAGAQAALGWLLARAAVAHPREPFQATAGVCPNCGAPRRASRTPYCSECCKDQAALIRQIRSGILQGTLDDPVRQIALGEKLWRVIGGGLPRRRSLLPVRGWERVLAREGRICQQCGAPATTIDHIGTG